MVEERGKKPSDRKSPTTMRTSEPKGNTPDLEPDLGQKSGSGCGLGQTRAHQTPQGEIDTGVVFAPNASVLTPLYNPHPKLEYPICRHEVPHLVGFDTEIPNESKGRKGLCLKEGTHLLEEGEIRGQAIKGGYIVRALIEPSISVANADEFDPRMSG